MSWQWFTLSPKFGDKFDENGQVYTEWYALAMKNTDHNWASKRHSVREKQHEGNMGLLPAQDAQLSVIAKGAKGAKGARSLRDLATCSVLHNILDIPLENIRAMPPWIVDRLWKEVVRSNATSLEIWKKFSFTLRNRKETTVRAMRYREAIESPKSGLTVYTTPLTSISYDFMAHLSITTAFPVSQLVKLSEIPNLGVLEIIKTSEMGSLLVEDVGDRLIRTWSEIASDGRAFGVLRILRLWNFKGVTNQSLQFVSRFPLLGIYDVRGCGFGGTSSVNARQLGWKVLVDPNILQTVVSACDIERGLRLTREHKVPRHKVYHATAEPLSDDTKVQRIHREDVDAFMVKSCTEELGQPEQHPGGATYRLSEADAQARPGKSVTRTFEHPSELFYGVANKERTWDYHLATTYAQLGELRADKDISGRGIHPGKQAVVGGELVNSFPMVSIRLGKHLPELQLESRYLATLSPGAAYSKVTSHPELDASHICFFRLEVPPVSGPDKSAMFTATYGNPKRKSVVSITERKKMKLGDVLGSFL